jgi:hypothetical protein
MSGSTRSRLPRQQLQDAPRNCPVRNGLGAGFGQQVHAKRKRVAMRIERIVVKPRPMPFENQVEAGAVAQGATKVRCGVRRPCALPVMARSNKEARLFSRNELLAIRVRVMFEDALLDLVVHSSVPVRPRPSAAPSLLG